ncbi:hypothetical protein [Enterococcus sp. 5H]|uniref:hypothetical protein n=1 Tax=Enterococcus sp. 5H TaxID=1229490 RepID=UPI0023026EC7|nr:hypothetical protein [Enterococcus sp. 5H]MDA9471184.1 hypothetical protein [Enterococcus sp. 5H]
MLDSLVDGAKGLVEGAKEELLNLRKTAEKQLIRLWVASQSHATSENRKKLTKEHKKQKIETLKSISNAYKSSFSSSAKGEWIEQAKNAVDTGIKSLDKL